MRALLVGARALLVELDDSAEVDALYAEIELRHRDGRLPALEEVVPADVIRAPKGSAVKNTATL